MLFSLFATLQWPFYYLLVQWWSSSEMTWFYSVQKMALGNLSKVLFLLKFVLILFLLIVILFIYFHVWKSWTSGWSFVIHYLLTDSVLFQSICFCIKFSYELTTKSSSAIELLIGLKLLSSRFIVFETLNGVIFNNRKYLGFQHK